MSENSNTLSMVRMLQLLPYFRREASYLILSSFGINVLMLAMPIALMQVYDRIIPNQSSSSLFWLMFGVVSAIVIETIMRIGRSMIGNWLSAGYEHNLSVRAVDSLVDMSHEQFDGVGAGVHLECLNSVNTLKSYFSGQLFQVIVDLPFIFLFVFVQYQLGGILVFYTVLLVLIFSIIVFLSAQRYEKFIKLHKDINNRQFNYIVEVVGGIHSVKSMSMEEQMLRRYESIQEGLTAIELKKNFWNHLPKNLSPIFSNINLLGVLSLGAILVLQGELTLGVMTACTMVATRILQPVIQASQYWMRKSEAEIAADQYRQLFHRGAIAEVDDFSEVPDVEAKLTVSDLQIFNDADGQKLNLEIDAGECVCVVGRNSLPTTRFAKSITGIQETRKGNVCIDEYDLYYWRHKHFNGRIEYISRNGRIFRGSILDNITMFAPEKYLIAQDAAALVDLDRLVSDLPQGYETPVNPASNMTLPQGLIQRICLARALVVRPRVLVIDRTLDALDDETKDILTGIIDRLRGSCIVVVISEFIPRGINPDKAFDCTSSEFKEIMSSQLGEYAEPYSEKEDERPLVIEDEKWSRWIMQTATRYEDFAQIIKQTGIEFIDMDHKRISEYAIEMNTLVNELNENISKDLIEEQKKILNHFYNFVLEHFEREEEFITKIGLEGLHQQKSEHGKILEMCREIIEDFKQGRSKITHSLKLSLMDWVVSHINAMDYETFNIETTLPVLIGKKHWDDLLNFTHFTGVPFVDQCQEEITRELVQFLNILYDSSDVEVAERLQRLKQSFEENLSKEIAFFHAFSLTTVDSHMREHSEIIQLLNTNIARISEGEYSKDEFVSDLLLAWMIHRNETDFADFAVGELLPAMIDEGETEKNLGWLIRRTGIEEIDEQHLSLVSKVMQTTYLQLDEMPTEELDDTLGEILKLVKNHFAFEEAHMKKLEIQNFESHREEHRHLLKTIEEYLDNVHNKRISFSNRFRLRILDWWVHHTNGTDYQSFVLNKAEVEE